MAILSHLKVKLHFVRALNHTKPQHSPNTHPTQTPTPSQKPHPDHTFLMVLRCPSVSLSRPEILSSSCFMADRKASWEAPTLVLNWEHMLLASLPALMLSMSWLTYFSFHCLSSLRLFREGPWRGRGNTRGGTPMLGTMDSDHTCTPYTSTPHTSTPHTSTPHTCISHTCTPHTCTPHTCTPDTHHMHT